MSVLSVFFLAAAAFAAEEERPRYCEEPVFIIRGEPETHSEPRDEEILNADEAADPALARALAATPGPYGHSELGFRYLARLFGYQGKFSSRERVESWLVREEAEDHARKKGLWRIWDKWVVHAHRRLAVPRGLMSRLPVNGDPTMFFLDERDRLAHARCLKVELAAQFCVNYEGRDRPLKEKDVVLFSASTRGAEKFGYCQVRSPPWRKLIEKRQDEEYAGSPNLVPRESLDSKTAK